MGMILIQQTMLEKWKKLVLEKGVDMVIGDRLSSTYFSENKRPFHNTGNRMVRFFVTIQNLFRFTDSFVQNRESRKSFCL